MCAIGCDDSQTGSPANETAIRHVPDTYQSIQAAIDEASAGDMIIVADGLYTGAGNKNLDFSGKAITIRSENGPENCIIDCEQTSAGVVFYSNEGRNSVLSGFTGV